jgi:hypothetical protein
MGFKHDEFLEFLEALKSVQRLHEKFIHRFLTEMGMRALAQTKKLTPVDTGELRNRWELSEIYVEGDTLCIDLINSLDYASFVEDGHWQRRRWVPGRWENGKFVYQPHSSYGPNLQGGMMLTDKWIPGHYMARISIAKVKKEIPKRYEKAFKEFIEELIANGKL